MVRGVAAAASASAATPGTARRQGGRPALQHGLTLLLLGLALLYTMALRRHSAADLSLSYVVADMGHQLYQPVRWLEGQWLYRDFSGDMYQPGAIVLHATLFRLFGIKASVVSTALALVGAGVSIMVYIIARRLVSTAWAVLAYLLALSWNVFSLNIGYPSWYVLLLGLIAVWVTLRYAERGGIWRLAVAGALAGVSCAFKINMGVYQLTGITLFLAWRSLQEQPQRGMWRRLLSWEGCCAGLATLAALRLLWEAPAWLSFLAFVGPVALVFWAMLRPYLAAEARAEITRRGFLVEAAGLVLGCAVVIGAWAFPMARSVGWRVLLDGALLKPLQNASGTFSPPLAPNTNGWLALGFMLAGALWLISRGEGRARWVLPYGASAAFLLAIPLKGNADVWSALETAQQAWASLRYIVFTVVCILGWRLVGTTRGRAGARDALAAVLICGGWGFLQAYPLADANHLLWAFQPALILLVFLGSQLTETLQAGAARLAERRSIALALGGLALALAGLQFSVVASHFVTLRPPFALVDYELVDRERVDIYATSEAANTLRHMSQAIVARAGERDTLLDISGAFFNYMTGRPNPTRYDALWPPLVSRSEQKRVVAALQTDRPALIVWEEAPDKLPNSHTKSVLQVYAAWYDFIGAQYRRELQVGNYSLWERK